MKIIWKVAEKQEFRPRRWPSASWSNDSPCACIIAEEGYHTELARNNDLPFDLIVRVAIKMDNNWEWRRMKKKFRSLVEAKKAVKDFFDANPSLRVV